MPGPESGGNEVPRTDTARSWLNLQPGGDGGRAATGQAEDCDPGASMRPWELRAMEPGTGKALILGRPCSTGREGLGVQFGDGTCGESTSKAVVRKGEEATYLSPQQTCCHSGGSR